MYSSRGRLRNQVVSTWFDLWWVIDLPCFEFEFRKFWWFYLINYFMWRNVFACLVMCRWQVWHSGQWWGSRQEYETWCRGPMMVKHRSGTQWPNDREVGWHCVWSAPYTRRWWAHVSWFSLKTKVDGFSWFGLKTGGYGSSSLPSKPLTRVSWFVSQNWQLRFGDLAHKITMTVSWFGPQNQVGYGLSVVPQNR
jgi:hypothetical protein